MLFVGAQWSFQVLKGVRRIADQRGLDRYVLAELFSRSSMLFAQGRVLSSWTKDSIENNQDTCYVDCEQGWEG